MDGIARVSDIVGAGGCLLTLCIIYCMLLARTAGKGTQRLSAGVIPASRTALDAPSAFKQTRQYQNRGNKSWSRSLPVMLRGALQKHEKENAVPNSETKSFFGSSPPSQSSQNRSSQSVNPGYRNPLKPTPASALNGFRSQRPQQSANGIKRTASGLAKATDGAFDDGPGSRHNPVSVGGKPSEKSNVVQIAQNDFIDEDAFDSDIDLDVEEPAAKQPRKHTKPPQVRTADSPTQSIVYPTLPRQQQAQTSFTTDLDPYEHISPAAANNPVGSSAPIPWSSSPAEHNTPAFSPSKIKAFTYKPADKLQHVQNGPPPPQPQQEPAKRRKLPWATQQKAEEVDNRSTHRVDSSKSKSKTISDATPASKGGKNSMWPWNTTASAVKEQQKQHREEFKRIVKKNDGDEESLRKAKSNLERPAKVFLSEEQQHVLNLVVDKKKSVFFTGSAGTGKSVLMREIISTLRKMYNREPDRVAVTASTGLAACNVGGVTLHSFAGIGLGKEDAPELVRKIKRNQKAKHRWMRTKVLVVDEVSMVDGDLFDKLETIARQLRNNGRPFGGIQLVITGDFFQLPPVPDSGRVAKFAFDAATWNTTIEHTIGLHHVFRQKDPSKVSCTPLISVLC